ncbi:glycosyltransferase family 4 protein [Pseudonocardia sp. TMWB2A]|uniref:glycosyltransferase n=1 Tax=Pseudonocardia sp. TMWB2A TaxID=687430 RepID=UPI00307CEDA0
MSAAPPLHVLSIASLFPDATRPNFGVFVERSLLEAARQPGVDLTIVAPIGVPVWPLSLHPRYREFAEVPQVEQWKGVTVYRPRFTIWPGTGGRFASQHMAKAILDLLQKLSAPSVDIIDAQFFYPDGPAAIIVGKALKRPVSIKARGSDIAYWGHQPATAQQINEAGHQADGLLAVSAALKTDMTALGMAEDQIKVHHSGLDADHFKPRARADAKAALGLSGTVISTVGALIPLKGQEIIIRALPLLPDISYVLAGVGADKERLAAIAEEVGVADRVRFAGAVPHKDIPMLLAASDAMILVSEREGLANAWLEALACGTPIVISNVGGAGEIAPGSDAVQIVERTPEAVAAAVKHLRAHPPLPDTTSAMVHARFSWQKNARELVAHWRKLAGL